MNVASDLIDFCCSDFEELVDSCSNFYEINADKWRRGNVLERRVDLSKLIKKFHKDCGTLTSSVQKAIEDLKEDPCIVLMTAHQPNLFPYSGVLRKATLNFVLAEQLEKRLGVRVINFFGIADQDFTDDRWVKSSQLPAVTRREGVLNLDVRLPEKLMLNMVPKPSLDLLKHWKAEIEGWLNNAVGSVDRFSKTFGLPRLSSQKGILHRNFRAFWEIVEEAYERSTTYSDFNAFVMSKIVNEAWEYDTLFSRFSECQQIFAQEFAYLLSRFRDYSNFMREATELLIEKGVGKGGSEEEDKLAPFWYHCDCGSKVRLFLELDESLIGYGDCVGCEKGYKLDFGAVDEPDISGVASRISARAIPMTLVFFKGLGVSCYVGGMGGVEYLTEARYVANKLSIPFPPTPVWRPHDCYKGIGQIEALQEYKRIAGSFNVEGHAEALDILRSRIAEIRRDIDRLEESKKKIVEKLRLGEGNETRLKEKLREISITQGRIKGSSKLSVLVRDLKILENIPFVLNLIPSIIDYAVNVGLKETSDQWIEYLRNGDLSSDARLQGVLDDLMIRGDCEGDECEGGNAGE